MCRPPQPSELVVDATKDAATILKEVPLPYARTEHIRHFGVTERLKRAGLTMEKAEPPPATHSVLPGLTAGETHSIH